MIDLTDYGISKLSSKLFFELIEDSNKNLFENLLNSIGRSLEDFKSHNNGEPPDKIFITLPLFRYLQSYNPFDATEDMTVFGIRAEKIFDEKEVAYWFGTKGKFYF